MAKRKASRKTRTRRKKGSFKSILIVIVVLVAIGSFGKSDDKSTTKSSSSTEVTVQTTKEDSKSQEITAEISQKQKEALHLDLNISTSEDSEDETEQVSSGDTGNGVRNENLKGRGRSDAGREEPKYVGIIGYAVVKHSEYDIENSDEWINNPAWTVPVYQKDKQFYEEIGAIPHKTEVLVKSQTLKHEGYGRYSGYLDVVDTETEEEYCIEVENFITKPYWNYDVEDVSLIGLAVAEFNQKSDYYPVTKSGKAEIADGTKVLVTGATGTYGAGGPDRDTNSIEAIVFANWKYGYGGVEVFFNSQDLTVIY